MHSAVEAMKRVLKRLGIQTDVRLEDAYDGEAGEKMVDFHQLGYCIEPTEIKVPRIGGTRVLKGWQVHQAEPEYNYPHAPDGVDIVPRGEPFPNLHAAFAQIVGWHMEEVALEIMGMEVSDGHE